MGRAGGSEARDEKDRRTGKGGTRPGEGLRLEDKEDAHARSISSLFLSHVVLVCRHPHPSHHLPPPHSASWHARSQSPLTEAD